MKKIWKIVLLCGMFLASTIGFTACGCSKDNAWVSSDLDGDKVISNWEEVFDINAPKFEALLPDVINEENTLYIKNFDDLKSINNYTKENKTMTYIIKANIDCGGESVCIDLGNSKLYGQNYVIRNFKLGEYDPNLTLNEEDTKTPVVLDGTYKCLFYNGALVSNVRVFVGYQDIDLNNVDNTYIATFANVKRLYNSEIRGRLNVDRLKLDDLNSSEVHICFGSILNESDTFVESFNLDIVGKIDYKESGALNATAFIGGASSKLLAKSSMHHVIANVDINTTSETKVMVGGIVGINYGFISSANAMGSITSKYMYGELEVGGIVGSNQGGELKNVNSNVKMNLTSDYNPNVPQSSGSCSISYAGGIVGNNTKGIISYVLSDSEIISTNIGITYTGGITGKSDDGIISTFVSRGAINISNAIITYISNISGIAKSGLIESGIVTTTININNVAQDGNVYIGSGAIFELDEYESIADKVSNEMPVSYADQSSGEIDYIYTANKSPYFKGLLLAGKNTINMRPHTDGDEWNNFIYNLGLRNYYGVKTPVSDDLEGDSETEIEYNYMYKFPDIFGDIYYISSYVTTKQENGADIVLSPGLNYCSKISTASDSVVFKSLAWFTSRLGFKSGLNHNEVDLSGISTETGEESLKTIRFTLNESECCKRYFEVEQYNHDMGLFDYNLDEPYHAVGKDANYDEFYSMLSYVIKNKLSGSKETLISFIMSKEFLSGAPEIDVESEDFSYSHEISDLYGAVSQVFDNENVGKFHNIIKQVFLDMGYLPTFSIDFNEIVGESCFDYVVKITTSKNHYLFKFDSNTLNKLVDEKESGTNTIVNMRVVVGTNLGV